MKPTNLTRREFITSTMGAAGAGLLPCGLAATRTSIGGASAVLVQPFPIRQVQLLAGPFKTTTEANRKYLHFLPSDRLLHMFRLTAGLPSSAAPLDGWEKPDCELRGHFSGGHYLSACAHMVATTGDDDLKSKANVMVAELAGCQHANGHGYLSAFPTEFFARLRAGKRVWAPFYTYHKIMAGHLDMYLHCGNEQALKTAEGMAGWAQKWSKGIGDDQMQRILHVEYGGMQEVLANLYGVTGKEEYLALSRRFDHRSFFDPLAERRDKLKGLHANTHVPQVIGAARRYEVTGDARDRAIADYFWHEVTERRCYCTGGTSNDEHWRTDPGILASQLSKATQECCVEYNMLKLTRHLFGWTADPRLADYYERTLFNSRLGTENPSNGMKMYFLPLAAGYWKYFSSPLDSFWCCTGTGAEEFSKFGNSIYFHNDRELYVNLFIASELSWPQKGLRLRQATSFPEEEGTTLAIEASQPVALAIKIRVPWWAERGATVKINGVAQDMPATPSSYITLARRWSSGDTIEVSLPMSLRIAAMPDDGTIQAVMYGPLVLAGRLGAEGLTREMMYGGYREDLEGAPVPAPVIRASSADPVAWVEPVAGQPLTFRAVGQSQPLELIPLYKLFNERYGVYWKVEDSA
jgi:DUF1680 family protein